MINKITGNEPAMSMCNEVGNIYSHGLTIRQHFAAMAMQGMLSSNWRGYNETDEDCKVLTEAAVKYADALIKELNKNPAAETGS